MEDVSANPKIPEVRIEEDAEALSLAAAEELTRTIETALAGPLVGGGRCSVALTGGSTPRAFYSRLAREPYRDRLPWPRIHFFWGDERHVPPGHPDSNFRMACESMLASVPVPPENIHRIPAEGPDAARAAAAYETALRGFFHLSPEELPRFDVVLLGLGADAHVASLFPESPALDERERLVAAPWVEKLAAFRITLTAPVINHAARILFVVSGEEKAEAVRAALEGEKDPMRYPAQLIEPENGTVLWLLDSAAASRLETGWSGSAERGSGDAG